MRKSLVLAALLLALALIPLSAAAATVEGTIQGLQCVISGKVCPVGGEDILATLESNFVLLDNQGKNWYVLVGLSPSFLSRFINVPFKVEGKMNQAQTGIAVQKAWAKRGDKWIEVWSPIILQRLRDKMEWNY